ncbi:uncharacterized protein LOC119375570 isoform X2 [Rhipicephalus sanguineus]|uniref:uncharacterized protein LOC119375570 isoform X2 n=1 Tax=Rhipicephalus sanguineus TaxID=34632 RepID=UPI00189324C0|nr:uncharacterized protein LOC119375570 isoform X2 [Rhipicephalus sanguineus]
MLEILTCLLARTLALAAAHTPEPPMYAGPYEAYRYEDANRVLRYKGDVHLFRASFGWNPYNTKCMKSRYLTESDNVVRRTIEYYGIPVRGSTFQYNIIKHWMKVIKPRNSQPYIYSAEDKTKVEKKTTEKPVKNPPASLPATLAPRELEYDGITLAEDEYLTYVLYADDKCVLTGHYNQTGESLVLLPLQKLECLHRGESAAFKRQFRVTRETFWSLMAILWGDSPATTHGWWASVGARSCEEEADEFPASPAILFRQQSSLLPACCLLRQQSSLLLHAAYYDSKACCLLRHNYSFCKLARYLPRVLKATRAPASKVACLHYNKWQQMLLLIFLPLSEHQQCCGTFS